MRKVYKYEIVLDSYQKVLLPNGSQILDVAFQHGQLFIWALVYPEAHLVKRKISIFGTGHTIPEGALITFIKTIHHDGMVWHVFEDLKAIV